MSKPKPTSTNNKPTSGSCGDAPPGRSALEPIPAAVDGLELRFGRCDDRARHHLVVWQWCSRLHLLHHESTSDAVEYAGAESGLFRLHDDGDHESTDGDQLLLRDLGARSDVVRHLCDVRLAFRLHLHLDDDHDRFRSVQCDRKGNGGQTDDYQGRYPQDCLHLLVCWNLDGGTGARLESVVLILIWNCWNFIKCCCYRRYVPEGNLSSCGTDFLNKSWVSRSYILVYSIFVYYSPLFLIIYSYYFIITVSKLLRKFVFAKIQ